MLLSILTINSYIGSKNIAKGINVRIAINKLPENNLNK